MNQRREKESRGFGRKQRPRQTRAIGYKPSICCRYCSTLHGSGDADDEREDGRHDERLQRMGVKRPRRASPLDGLALYGTSHLIPFSTKVSHATGRNLQWVQRSLRSPRIFQDPNALTRSGGRDHV